jgi:hypothetical protein
LVEAADPKVWRGLVRRGVGPRHIVIEEVVGERTNVAYIDEA